MRPVLHLVALFLAWTASAQQFVSPPFEVYRTTVGQGETFSIGNGLSAGKLDDDIIYAVTSQGSVYTLRESDGVQLNVYTRNNTNATSSSRLDWDKDGEFGVYAERNSVILMDSEGAYVDEFTVSGVIVGQPIIHFGNVFVSHNEAASGNGLVTIYSPVNQAVVAQFTRSGARVGPCGKNSDSAVYYGTSQGEVIGMNVSDLSRRVVADGFKGDITGTPFVTPDESHFLIQSQQGVCYLALGPESGTVEEIQCNDGISSVGALVPPMLAKNNGDFYVVGGSTIYTWRPQASIQWAQNTDQLQTKAVLDSGEFVYSVGSDDGRINKFSAATGFEASGYPYYCDSGNSAESCSDGAAEAYALLSEDESKILRVFNDGTIVVTCVECLPSNAPSIFGIPTTSPTMFPSGLATTIQPSIPPTLSPVPPFSSPPSGGRSWSYRCSFTAVLVILLAV